MKFLKLPWGFEISPGLCKTCEIDDDWMLRSNQNFPETETPNIKRSIAPAILGDRVVVLFTYVYARVHVLQLRYIYIYIYI